MTGDTPHLTERQQKWFDSIKASFQRDTGRTLEEWVEIARSCPEAKPRARQQWLKENYGLGVNRASAVLSAAFPSGAGWDQPNLLRAELWKEPVARGIFEAFEAAVTRLPGVVAGQRKGYSAFSRKVQFTAAKPLKDARVLVGLAVGPEADPRLVPRGRSESWSERLTAQLTLGSEAEVDGGLQAILRAAWERS